MSADRSAQDDKIVVGRRGGGADRVFEGADRKVVGVDFDDVEIGRGNTIPLWMFGLLY